MTDAHEHSHLIGEPKTRAPQDSFFRIIRKTTSSGVQRGAPKTPSYRVVSSSGEYVRNNKMRKRAGSQTSSSSRTKYNRGRSSSRDRRLIGGTVDAVSRNTPGSKRKRSRSLKSNRRRSSGSRGRGSSRSRSPSPTRSGRHDKHVGRKKSPRARSPSKSRRRH